jgi:hypothetical protein
MEKPRQVVLHVALEHIEPQIWRRIRVPESYSLHQLHRILQIVFSWLDYHLYAFQVGNRRFEKPSRESEYESSIAFTLGDLQLKAGQRFVYTYDFGDDWRHSITVESFLPLPSRDDGDWSPRLMAGARAAPPEDCLGPPGYELMLKSRLDSETGEVWASIPEGFDPERFDPWALDHALSLAAVWGAI